MITLLEILGALALLAVNAFVLKDRLHALLLGLLRRAESEAELEQHLRTETAQSQTIAALEARVRLAEGQIAALTAQTAEIPLLREKVTTLERDHEHDVAEIMRLKTQHDIDQKKLATQTKRRESLERRLREQAQRIRDLEARIQELESHVTTEEGSHGSKP